MENNYIHSGDSIDLNRVAKNLRKLRIDNNLKQRDIFNMLNIASQVIQYMKLGKY